MLDGLRTLGPLYRDESPKNVDELSIFLDGDCYFADWGRSAPGAWRTRFLSGGVLM